MEKYYVYKVEKVEDFENTATTISHNYDTDFEEYCKLRGYVKIDYYITDTEGMVDGKVYCCGNFLVKALECVTSFEGEPIRLKFDFEDKI